MVNNTPKHNGKLSASIVSGDYKPGRGTIVAPGIHLHNNNKNITVFFYFFFILLFCYDRTCLLCSASLLRQCIIPIDTRPAGHGNVFEHERMGFTYIIS